MLKPSALAPALALALLGTTSAAHAQFIGGGGNPFSPPNATMHYAPDRDYDLQHIAVDVTVDYPNRAFAGTSTNTIVPLRDEQAVHLNAGKGLQIRRVDVDGRQAQYTRDGDLLTIPGQFVKGRRYNLRVTYSSVHATGKGFSQGEGGWHWLEPTPAQPEKIGFWTQGETGYNRNWAPTWDYPNDFTTSETRTTVPADWTVVGNGVLVSNTLNPGGKTRTFVWKLDIPHATYLLSLVGGPLEVKRDNWRGVELLYVVPKGRGKLIEPSFGDTPDMLSFYSDRLGYKYPWPKYAQDAMFDFGGGMENVSATTLAAGSLTDAREGFHNMASLNSHELGHQWFGDTVTCKDWGQVWLNESFATYMQIMYFEHSRGKNAYDREIDSSTNQYVSESRQYKRPLATKLYSSPDVMFDRHTYPKGGVILHTLRRQIGDDAFFAGLHQYLMVHQHTPVESQDLATSITDATGIDVQPFFDQWIYKPGHPVLDYSWTYTGGNVVVHVLQKQDTKDGTPIYTIPAKVGVISGGRIQRYPITLDKADQEFTIATGASPDAVLLDPDHDFLREIPKYNWARPELLNIVRFAPSGLDRSRAMRMVLSNNPTDDEVHAIADVVAHDNELFPAIDNISSLAALKREDLRPLFESLLNHPSFGRRAEAVRALGQLNRNPATESMMRSLINDKAPYAVVTASLDVLSRWDADANMDVFKKAASMPSVREQIRSTAFVAMSRSKSPSGMDALIEATQSKDQDMRVAALRSLGDVDASEPRSREALRAALGDSNLTVVFAAMQAAASRKDRELIPAIRALQDRKDLPDFIKPAIDQTIQAIQAE
jgi:aminopeptidase N